MAGLIDRIGPVKLRPRRLPPFQSLTAAAWYLWRTADFLDGEGW
jgi:hypothetical protein